MDFRYPSSACKFLAIFLASAAPAAQAAPPTPPWTDTHAPSSADIKVMGKSGRGTLIAGTSYGYLFRSADGGETWTRTWEIRTNQIPKSIQTSGDSLILALYSNTPTPWADCFNMCTYPYRSVEVLASRNDGLSWTIEPGLSSVFAIGPGPEGSVLAAGSQLRIHARGDTAWKPLAFGFSGPKQGSNYPYWTAINSTGTTLIGIYDSVLYGAEYIPGKDSVTFTKAMDTAATSLYQFKYDILVSTAQGLISTRFFPPNGRSSIKTLLDTSKVSGLMEADSGYVIGRSGNRLRRGKALGGAWEAWGPELPVGVQAAIWRNRDVIAGGSGFPQFQRSVSAGQWTGLGAVVSEFQTNPLLVTRDAIYASTYQGVMVSKPNGEWSRVGSLGPEKNVTFLAQGSGSLWAGGNSLWRAAGDPINAPWIIPRGIPTGFNPQYYGATGKLVIASYFTYANGGYFNSFAICPVDGDSCLTTAVGALGKSPPNPQGIPYPISNFAGTGDTILASGSPLYRSVDGGRTWDTAKSPSTQYYDYQFIGKRLYAISYLNKDCGPGNCFDYSDDLGETWTSIPRGRLEKIRSRDLRVNGGFFFAATDSGIYSSRDGLEWTDLGRPSAIPTRLAVGDGLIAAGTDDSRILIREVESVGLNPARSGSARKDAGARILRNGTLVLDAHGTYRRMDGKAAASPKTPGSLR